MAFCRAVAVAAYYMGRTDEMDPPQGDDRGPTKVTDPLPEPCLKISTYGTAQSSVLGEYASKQLAQIAAPSDAVVAGAEPVEKLGIRPYERVISGIETGVKSAPEKLKSERKIQLSIVSSKAQPNACPYLLNAK